MNINMTNISDADLFTEMRKRERAATAARHTDAFPVGGPMYGPTRDDLKSIRVQKHLAVRRLETRARAKAISDRLPVWDVGTFEDATAHLTGDYKAAAGTSRFSDLENDLTWDDRASHLVVGGRLKIWAARSFNRSEWLDHGTHIEARQDGSTYKRPLTDVASRLSGERSDLHQRDNGDRAIAACLVPERFDSDRNPTGALGVYLVDAYKQALSPTEKNWKLWASIMGPGRRFTRGSWFYHPERVIRLGGFVDTEAVGSETLADRWVYGSPSRRVFVGEDLHDYALTAAYRWGRELLDLGAFPEWGE